MVNTVVWAPDTVREITKRVDAVKVGIKGGLCLREEDTHRQAKKELVEEEMREKAARQDVHICATPPGVQATPTVSPTHTPQLGGVNYMAEGSFTPGNVFGAPEGEIDPLLGMDSASKLLG